MESKFTLKNGNQLILPTIIEGSYANHWKDSTFTNEHHHQSFEAISSSGLKEFLDSPYTYLSSVYDRQNGINKKPSRSMKFGTIAHQMILEPEVFRKNFIVMPDFGDQRKKENKLTKELWLMDIPKSAVLFTSQDEYDDFIGVVSAIANHKKARDIFKEGVSEVSGFFKHEKTGILCRIRPDFISTRKDLNLFLDLKTARDSSYRGFQKAIWEYRYDIQLALYREGIKQITGHYPEHSGWVVVENKRPYEVAIYTASESTLSIGEMWLDYAMNRLKKCLETLDFPQRQTKIETMCLPKYAEDEPLPEDM